LTITEKGGNNMQINFEKAYINAKLTNVNITKIRDNVYNIQLWFNNEEQINFDMTSEQKQMVIDKLSSIK